jgi:hypothetical protein
VVGETSPYDKLRVLSVIALISTVEPLALTQEPGGFIGIYSNHKNVQVGLKGIRDE